ncbi:hypothetical protein A2W13_03120 [Candidatus Woesebacteria bacterium RBG_16_36_11]|uniref:O-antigen ligase-related domain-containing protein n=3 Tax=Candidatus Woeseibacteriota TaxID=1752722 RepID=A0A1F7XBQ4_9BACT|nr:MAG: hypothetical protein A2Z67_00200 [Candidatus Woesebacteria bacterium RBG_13_36_22]OGM12450.1 MAG: hypothetical protein A2W13_03120 [Candidatus Woesebacteria bacterium RBG_16_36_11]OGM15629.1 MAG: hypothetical protein A2V55_02025 [Candidatus Woesebacteria bacterium RBG_19FT_COMBO_37_29]
MIKIIDKLIRTCFYVLFFILPIVIFPLTSEIFEFNKITIVYLATVIITGLWLTKLIILKKPTLRRTILDIPILIFLASQVIATITSIDRYTSIFGYYSRFNGGLLSQISYTLLYFAFVNNMSRKSGKKILLLLISSLSLVSIYGILEHFGVDKNLWVQDVQNRVFSTLGQPNWLAALIIAVIPITWIFILQTKITNFKSVFKIKNIKWLLLSSLFFLTLLYTKSRSGLIGFAFANIFFWILIFKTTTNFKANILKPFIILNLSFVILTLWVGSPWTPSVSQIINRKSSTAVVDSANAGPALEVGGTGSGEIRKIVWKGAFAVFKAYPIFGSGVETFAYSYYRFRPPEHNLISEWDFLYNKAHNEYLNYLATTGIIGSLSYLVLIAFIFILITNLKLPILKNKSNSTLNVYQVALISGFLGIVVTNFFGFSVVMVSFLFFLYPAIAVSLKYEETKDSEFAENYKLLSTVKKILSVIPSLFVISMIYFLYKYWYSDILYTQGKQFNKSQNYPQGRVELFKATKNIPGQSIYWDELSQSAAGLAIDFYQTKDMKNAKTFSEVAIDESNHAVTLSPANLNIRKNNAALFIKLANLDPDLLKTAEELIKNTIQLSPTDAKLYYNLGLVQARIGKTDEAIASLAKTVELKSNYRDARFALALLYTQKGEKIKAKNELLYILEKINPQDEMVKQQLQEI